MPSTSTPLNDADFPGRGRRARRGAAAGKASDSRSAGRGRRPKANETNEANEGSVRGAQAADVDSASTESGVNTAGMGRAAKRQAARDDKKSRRARQEDSMIDGLPTYESLKPVLSFLIFPALIVLGITITGGHWPKAILYPIAVLMGMYVAWSCFKGVELVLAVMLLYVPFSPVYVIPLAPGLNGTNSLLALGLLATIVASRNRGHSWFNWLPGTSLVLTFAFITSLSAITITFQPGGYEWLMYHNFAELKGWIEQFIFYFVALSCIRDHDTAKRVFFYMCVGSVIVVIYSLPEMYDKMGRSSIEKSRVEGPLKQSNDFGGYIAYTLTFLGAVFLSFFKNLKAWLLTPYFLVALKLLISTFSRGAYLAIAFGGVMAAYMKGKAFLFYCCVAGITLILLFPQLVPNSVMDRINASFAKSESTSAPQQLDKSSEHRLILWKAAGDMILESPIQGKGFKGFPLLKGEYTERPVHESDPHNFYLYLASQMGIPAMVLFLFILLFAFHSGAVLSKHKTDRSIRAIGIAGAASTATYGLIAMFGSRAVSPEFTAYFWVMVVLMQVLRTEEAATPQSVESGPSRDLPGGVAGRRRRTAEAQAGNSKLAGRRRGRLAYQAEMESSHESNDDQGAQEMVPYDDNNDGWVQTGRRQSRRNGRKRTNAFLEQKKSAQRQLPRR